MVHGYLGADLVTARRAQFIADAETARLATQIRRGRLAEPTRGRRAGRVSLRPGAGTC